jgi:hypothetical protein
MEPRPASPTTLDQDAAEFVRFCYRRRRVGWPELYDEMCAVSARGLYRGMSADDLAGLGIGFSLFDMPALAALANTIVAEEHAKRRPVAVAIVAEEAPLLIETATAVDEVEIATRGTASFEHVVAAAAVEADVSAHVQAPQVPERQPERGLGVPVRLIGAAATV